MRKLLLLCLLSVPAWATAYTSASKCASAACVLSDRTAWTPDPGAGNFPGMTASNYDTITVAAGHHVQSDPANPATYGRVDVGVGDAITIQASTSGTLRGWFEVVSGSTVTVLGHDTSTNRLIYVVNNSGSGAAGILQVRSGGTLLGSSPGVAGSLIQADGTVVIGEASGTKAHLSLPAGSYSWNTPNTQAGWGYFAGYRIDHYTSDGRSVSVFPISTNGIPNYNWLGTRAWISNAAGTGPGSCTDSSLTFSAKTYSGGVEPLKTEVCDPALLDSPDKYWVDYKNGAVRFPSDTLGTVNATISYKYLSVTNSWNIVSAANKDYNALIVQNAQVDYLGKASWTTWQGALTIFAHDMNTSVDAFTGLPNRAIQIVDNSFNYVQDFLGTSAWPTGAPIMKGTAANHVQIARNSIIAGSGDAAIIAFTTFSPTYPPSYIDVLSNTVNAMGQTLVGFGLNAGNRNNKPVADNIRVTDNVGSFDSLMGGEVVCSDCESARNVVDSFSNTSQWMHFGVSGAPGHRFQVHDNVTLASWRFITAEGETDVFNNLCVWANHHTIVGPRQGYGYGGSYQANSRIHHNVIAQGKAPDTPPIMLGYQSNAWASNYTYDHNTLVANYAPAFALADGGHGEGAIASIVVAGDGTATVLVAAQLGMPAGYAITISGVTSPVALNRTYVTVSYTSTTYNSRPATSWVISGVPPTISAGTYTPTGAMLGLCGGGDIASYNLDTHATIRDNLAVFVNPMPYAAIPPRVQPDGTQASYTGMDMMGFNWWYNIPSPATGEGLNFEAVVTRAGSAYNGPTRPWSLWNPTYAAGIAGTGTVKWTAATRSLQWSKDGTSFGSAVTVKVASYTVAALSGCATGQWSNFCIAVSGTPFSTTLSDANSPLMQFVRFTSGVLAGQGFAVTTNGTSTLNLAPVPGTLPSVGDTFEVLIPQVNLYDATGNDWVTLTIDPRYLPASDTTDTGITIATTTSTANVDPRLVNGLSGTYSLSTQQAFAGLAPRLPSICTADSTGKTPGAVPCISALMAPLQ